MDTASLLCIKSDIVQKKTHPKLKKKKKKIWPNCACFVNWEHMVAFEIYFSE